MMRAIGSRLKWGGGRLGNCLLQVPKGLQNLGGGSVVSWQKRASLLFCSVLLFIPESTSPFSSFP